MIRSAADVPEGFSARTAVCVIGSGAGGGVAAAVLAEAGHEVFVLEEGEHVPAERMTQREEEMYPLIYRDGGNQQTDDGAIAVLQGRVLGGSTVVNMADVEPVPSPVLAHWRRFGVTRYGLERVREAEAVCREVIGVNPIGEVNRNNDLLLQGAAALGLPHGTFDHNRVGCVKSGYCLVGCAYDAKRSVALTWIPRAIAAGALVQTQARVERLEHDGRRVTAAVGTVGGAPFRVEADRFVLAAGAIHSPLLLRSSGLGGAEVGQHLSLQPQAPVAALFGEDVVPFRGIPQSAFVNLETATEEAGLGGFRLEGISATPGMSAASTALHGPELHALMRRWRQMAACLCLAPDRPGGRVTDKDGRPRIRYALAPETEATLREAIRTAARVYLAAGAEQVLLPFPEAAPIRSEKELAVLDRLRIRSAATPMISAHPQGTCRMGSVVGLDLRLNDNLWVMDASVFPTTSSSHTMLPVMAFAWLAATEMA